MAKFPALSQQYGKSSFESDNNVRRALVKTCKLGYLNDRIQNVSDVVIVECFHVLFDDWCDHADHSIHVPFRCFPELAEH